MKKNIKYIVAAVAGLWLTGCTDDLDRFPLSSLSLLLYHHKGEGNILIKNLYKLIHKISYLYVAERLMDWKK